MTIGKDEVKSQNKEIKVS
ncbi:hypothetical protein [Pedobacter steynii]